jgi:hypothetical protein
MEDIHVCLDYRRLNDSCVHEPFPTPFSDEVRDQVVGNEVYSFIDGFSGYHQVRIAKEDKKNTTFTIEWRSFSYNVMPFRIKNSPTMFYQIVITTFCDFIHKFLEVYLDDCTMYILLKEHTRIL